MDAGGIALAILDGEAVPAGGMGIAKQLKDEIFQCPPMLVLTGRPQDAWLATWSRAEAAVPHPIDPVQLAEAVIGAAPVARARHRLTGRDDADLARRPLRARRADATSPPSRPPGRWGRSSPGRPRPPRSPASRSRCGAKGETVDECSGLVEAMYAAATPISVPGRLLDVVGTGGDRSMSVNISTMAAIVAAGRGRARGQARQPLGVLDSPGRADVLEALGIRLDLPVGPGRRAGRRGRHHLLLRGRLPPGDAARRRAAARARHRHDVQLPRPAGQPGPAGRPGDRLRRPADGTGHGRGLRRARRRRLGLPRRRRARRAHHDRPRRRCGRCTAARSRSVDRRPGRPTASRRRHRGRSARRRRGAQRRRRTPPARRRAGAGARRRTAQRGRGAGGLRRAGRRRSTRRWPPGSPGPARRSTRVPRRPPSSAGSPRTADG